MRTLKQFVIRHGKKSEAEAEELTRELMQWLRERQAESLYSLDELTLKLADRPIHWIDPIDLESFFACDNPWFHHYWEVLWVLGEPLSEMMRIIDGLPEDPYRLSPRLRDQIRRGFEIGGTGYIDDSEDGDRQN